MSKQAFAGRAVVAHVDTHKIYIENNAMTLIRVQTFGSSNVSRIEVLIDTSLRSGLRGRLRGHVQGELGGKAAIVVGDAAPPPPPRDWDGELHGLPSHRPGRLGTRGWRSAAGRGVSARLLGQEGQNTSIAVMARSSPLVFRSGSKLTMINMVPGTHAMVSGART